MRRLFILALSAGSFLPVVGLTGCHDDDHDWDRHHNRRIDERPAGYRDREDVIIRDNDRRDRDRRDRADRDDRIHY